MPDLKELWYDLNRQPVHAFADWPNREIPKGKPGVYLIYQGVRLIYVGMAKKNLLGRLTQHARGNRSGDQFCVYLGDRLVMPKLGIDQMKDLFRASFRSTMKLKSSPVPNCPTDTCLSKMIPPPAPSKPMVCKSPRGRGQSC